jgi:hypothetical protein
MPIQENKKFPNCRPDRFSLVFIVFSLALAAYLIWNALQWSGAIRSYEARFAEIGANGRTAADVPGRIFLDNDAYYWTGYAQEMAATGAWRIRHTTFDNPPAGRPVHWSQSVSWLLLLAGAVRHGATGEALSAAIESAAIWIGPLLQFLLIAGTGWALFRRMGLVPALVWMANLATIPSIGWTFHPMRPDHHGLHLGFTVASGLCLVLGGLGWTRAAAGASAAAPAWFRPLEPPGRRAARRWAAAAGILGGLGLWTGASVQVFGTFLFAAGAGLLLIFLPAAEERNEGTICDPRWWRTWAVAGAGTALVFYLVEYAPSFPGMRLEVNHPLYAFAWVCAGELLVRWSRAKVDGKAPALVPAALLALGAALLPLLLVAGPVEWHAMRDPLMQRLHRFIDEFQPYLTTYAAAPWLETFRNFGLLPLFVAAAPFLAGGKRTTPPEWAALWMALFAALGHAALMLWQTRWMNFCAASSLLLAVVVLAILWRQQTERGRVATWFFVLVAAVAAQPLLFLKQNLQDIHVRDIARERIGELISPMLQRQFAQALGALDTNGVFRVMAGPHMAARLQYFGHVPDVDSYYWENRDGLRAAADFFAAETDAEALRIVRERGITHAVLPPSAELVRMFHAVKHGKVSEAGERASLAGRMLGNEGALPLWIRRDLALERSLQRGYWFNGEPVFGTLRVFVIPENRPEAVDKP